MFFIIYLTKNKQQLLDISNTLYICDDITKMLQVCVVYGFINDTVLYSLGLFNGSVGKEA